MNTRTTTRKTNEALDSLCYVCGTAANTRMFINNLCPSCCTPTAPETTLDATCDRIVEHNPISGTHALRAAHAVPPVPSSTSTDPVHGTGNPAAGTGVNRTGNARGNSGDTAVTLGTEDACSPVRTFTVPGERDLSVLDTAGPETVRGNLVPLPDSPRTAPTDCAGNQERITLPEVPLGTQQSSQDAPAMGHPGRGSCTQTNISTDPRSDVYIPNGKHRRCSFTPRKRMLNNKECSKDTQGDHTLPASQHIGENQADGGQLEHLDLPADARVKHGKQGTGCLLLRFRHKIHRLSTAGGLCTDELHLAIQLELRMECRFIDKPYVLMTTGDNLPRRFYSTFFTEIPEDVVLQIVFVNHDGVAACLDPAEIANCTTGCPGIQQGRTTDSPGFDTPDNSLAAIPSPLKGIESCLPPGRHSEHNTNGAVQTTTVPIINSGNMERLIPSTIAYMQTAVQGIMEPRPDIRNHTYVHSRGVLVPEPGKLYHITYGRTEEKENDSAGEGTYRYHAIHPPVVEERGEAAAEPRRPTSSEHPLHTGADSNGFAITEMTNAIPNQPVGCQTTLHRPSAILARDVTTAVPTPTAGSMGKIISNRQGKRDGKQEYLLQYGRGLFEFDRTDSYTYSWMNENDLRMTEEGGVLITAYADELKVRRAAEDLEVHRAAGAATLRPKGDDPSKQTAPEATGNSQETAAEPTKEVVLLAYLQEEPPPVRRRLSRSTTVRSQPAGLAAGQAASQANGSHPEVAQPAAVETSGTSMHTIPASPQVCTGASHGVQSGNSTSAIHHQPRGDNLPRHLNQEPLESNRESDGRFSSRPTDPESAGPALIQSRSDPESAGPALIRSRSDPESAGPTLNRDSGIPQKQRLNRSGFSTSTSSNSAGESTGTGTSTGTGPQNSQDPGTTEINRNPGDIPNPEVRERMRNSGTGTHRSRGTANGAAPMPNSTEPSHAGNNMPPPRTNSRTNEGSRPRRAAAGAPSGNPSGDDDSDDDDGDGGPQRGGPRRSASPIRRRRRRGSNSEGEDEGGTAGGQRPSRSRSPRRDTQGNDSDSRSRSRSSSRSGRRSSSSQPAHDRLDSANERLRLLAGLTVEDYVRCVLQSGTGEDYLDMAMKNAQAARDLESRQSGANGNVPRPPAVRLPRELEWPKIENPYRHVDRRTPTEFRRTLEMQTNHVAASLRTSHLLTRAVEAKVNQAVIAEFVNPLRANGTIYAKAADIDYDEIFVWLNKTYGPIDRKSTCTRNYLDLRQLPNEDCKQYVGRRMLRKAELDRLGIEAILPDLERQLLLSSVEPSLAIWLKTNTPDFESTDPSDLARLMIIRDQAVRSAQKSHKHGGQNNRGAPQRNLNAMVKRKGQSNSGQFKRKNSFAPAKGKGRPRTQALYAMWDNDDGNSAKSYSQSKRANKTGGQNGAQLPSLRDMKSNYSDALWNKRVDENGRPRKTIDAQDPKNRAMHCNDCWPAGSTTKWCLMCRKSGHDLTSCIKLSKRSKQQGNGKGKGRGQGKHGKSKGRANSW